MFMSDRTIHTLINRALIANVFSFIFVYSIVPNLTASKSLLNLPFPASFTLFMAIPTIHIIWLKSV